MSEASGWRESWRRISRHRSAWEIKSDTSSCRSVPGSTPRNISLVTTWIVASGVPSSCAAAAARPPSADSRLLTRQNGLRGGQRQLHPLAFRLRLPSIGGGEDDAHRRGDADALDIEIR